MHRARRDAWLKVRTCSLLDWVFSLVLLGNKLPRALSFKLKGLEMLSTTGIVRSYCQCGPIQDTANLMCGNTQGPNLFTHNLQWHNPITQPVIGIFHTVQHSTGSVIHSVWEYSLASWCLRCSPHTLPLPFHALSSQPRACRVSFLSVSPSLPPRICIFSLIHCSSPSLSPPYHGHSIFCGQQKTLFSSLLSTAMEKLAIHLLGLPYSLPRLPNPSQLQSLDNP